MLSNYELYWELKRKVDRHEKLYTYNIIIFYLLIILVCFIIIMFVKTCIDLRNYRECYDNNFKEEYCEKYRNY